MYMRNNGYNKYAKYNSDDFPPNYSGQYTKDSVETDDDNSVFETDDKEPESVREIKEVKEIKKEKKESESDESREKRNGSLLGNLFGGHKDNRDNRDNRDGKKGGLLSGLFSKDGKDGGFLSHIELEDLILLAVIFFLLKDGFEDDLILILAIILFSS